MAIHTRRHGGLDLPCVERCSRIEVYADLGGLKPIFVAVTGAGVMDVALERGGGEGVRAIQR